MNETSSKTQQIKGLSDVALASSRKFGVNDARTCAKIDTPLTRACSLAVRPSPAGAREIACPHDYGKNRVYRVIA
jgi:hypothetical protein